MADNATPQHARGRGRRGRGFRKSNRTSGKPPPLQSERRPNPRRGRPLPRQHRSESHTYSDHTGEQPYPTSHRESSSRYQQDRSLWIWWQPLSKDKLPHEFQPRKCVLCEVLPSDPWAMIMHLCSAEHCDNFFNSKAEDTGYGREVEKRFRCDLCRTDLIYISSVRSHFNGWKHRSNLHTLRRDLKAAGFPVPSDDDSRFALINNSSGTATRSMMQDDRLSRNGQQSESSVGAKVASSRNKASSTNLERVPSRNEERYSDDDKDSRTHKYFLSSEDDQSEDEGINHRVTRRSESDPGSSRDVKPRLPVISVKSLVDKRKAIISKLSNCTDVRDLTKHLRQISRGKSEEKSARKALPGVAFTDREIEQQETFAEARAQRMQTEIEPITVDDDGDDSDNVKAVVKNELKYSAGLRNSRNSQRGHLETEECEIVAPPAQALPETISDSDTGDEEQQPAESTPSSSRTIPAIETPSDLLNSQLQPSEFGKLGAIVTQEVALAEKLRYLSQTLPRIEALISQLRQEHQNVLTQMDLLRAAKNRIVTGISRGSPSPRNADVFDSNLILNTLLQPTTAVSNVSWPAQNSNGSISSILQSLGVSENVLQATTSNNTESANSNSSSKCNLLPTTIVANNSSTIASTSVSLSAPNEKKRTTSRDSSSNSEAKRSRNIEFDEQLHSEIVLVVRLDSNHVYTSSKDGIVKRTPIQDESGSVILYKHCGEDSNSKLSKVCAHMLEVNVHKKVHTTKVITGSNDCAIRVFDGSSGHLIKIVPVQARVQCGIVHWQKIYVGLKSGYIQVYNLENQRYMTESQHKQVPKLMSENEISNSKSIVVVTEDNSMLIRDAGTLFVLHAVERLEQEVTALMIKDDHIFLSGRDKIYVYNKNAKLSLTVNLASSVFRAVAMKSGILFAGTDGTLRSSKWKGIFVGNEQVQQTMTFARDSRTVVASMNASESMSCVALATDEGRVIVFKLATKSC